MHPIRVQRYAFFCIYARVDAIFQKKSGRGAPTKQPKTGGKQRHYSVQHTYEKAAPRMRCGLKLSKTGLLFHAVGGDLEAFDVFVGLDGSFGAGAGGDDGLAVMGIGAGENW